MNIGPNDPCPCGSGKKYKNCCAGKVKVLPIRPIPRIVPSDERCVIPATASGKACREVFTRLWKWLDAAENQAEWREIHQDIPGFLNEDSAAGDPVGDLRHDWLLFFYHDRNGRSFADKFLGQFGSGLTAEERAILLALAAEPIRLVEFREIRPNGEALISDIFSEEEFTVRFEGEPGRFRKWELRLVHLCVFADRFEFLAWEPVDRLSRDVVLDTIEDYLFELESEDPHADHVDAIHEYFPEVLAAVAEGFQAPGPEEADEAALDGDLILYQAYYQMTAEGEVRRLLAEQRDFCPDEETENGFLWLERPKAKGAKNAEPRILGRVVFEEEGLILEAPSREDLVKGKKMLDKTFGDRLRHVEDSEMDLNELSQEDGAEPDFEDMKQYLASWVDAPMEELDGMSPRVAARDPELVGVLREYLKDLEYAAENRSDIVADIERIRRELNLAE